jgi:hypothetical protein
MKAIFHRDGDHYLPQSPARGPWGESLHGGAPAALLAQALTDLVAAPFPLARLTLDMFRPVPLAPLALTGTVLRKGKRLALAEMTLSAEGVPCARALGLFSAPSPLPEGAVPPTPCPLPRGEGAVVETLAEIVASRVGRKLPPGDGLHHHLLAEGFDGAVGGGRGAAWLSLPLTLTPEQPLTPMTHLAALADFANGMSQRRVVVDGRNHGYINADISLHILREPALGPLALLVDNHADRGGRAVISGQFFDDGGLVAQVVQSGLVNPTG